MCARGGNLHCMGKKRKEKGHGGLKAFIITVSVLVLLAGAAAAVYFLAFDTVSLFSDTSFRQVVPSGTITKLRLRLALDGKRLNVVAMPDQCFGSPDVFRSVLASSDCDYAILSPVPAAYAVINEVDVSDLLPDTVVVGIHDGTGISCFDVSLVSDELSGWEAAAAAISAETASMSRNIALVYENEIEELAQAIVNLFPAGHVTEFRKKGALRMFASSSLDTMDEQGIVLAMCPYVNGFANFFNRENPVSWIVDYRFASTVPAASLYGVVAPDFGSLPAILRNAEKGSRMTVTLDYIYEKR